MFFIFLTQLPNVLFVFEDSVLSDLSLFVLQSLHHSFRVGYSLFKLCQFGILGINFLLDISQQILLFSLLDLKIKIAYKMIAMTTLFLTRILLIFQDLIHLFQKDKLLLHQLTLCIF